MKAVLLPNSLDGNAVIPPTHKDGRGYKYCMYFQDDSQVAFADSYLDLIDVLIPDYSQMSEKERNYQRIHLAQAVALRTQNQVIGQYQPDDASPDEWAVLRAPRALSQPRADWWECKIPLIVVETGYEPFTDIPRPSSAFVPSESEMQNLWWIRPADEEDFLMSLHEVSYIQIMASQGAR
jgi:hypothetical protein